jgi:colanic acid biosynthesis glycosyl transferase WcaI
MRILVVAQYFPPEPVKVGDVVRGLRELGHDITVVTGFPEYPYGKIYPGYRMRMYQRDVRDGVRIIRVPIFPDHSYSRPKRFLNYASFALAGSILGPLLAGAYERIVVFQTSPVSMAIPAVVCRWLHRRSRLVIWVQDLWPDTLVGAGVLSGGWLFRIIGWLARRIYASGDLVLAQSPGMVEKLAGYGVAPERLRYLPNWADDVYGVIPPDPAFTRAEGLDGGFNVVFAGTIGVAQNLEAVVQAAALLRDTDVRFVIVGDGAMHAQIVDLAARLGVRNVVFKGRRPPEQMPKFFAAADALLVALLNTPLFARTIPAKLQAYMACGRPIIAALEGDGAGVVVESGGGLVCRAPGPEGLRDAVMTMRRLPAETRDAMGRHARRYYEAHFDRGLILARLNRLLAAGQEKREAAPWSFA